MTNSPVRQSVAELMPGCFFVAAIEMEMLAQHLE